MATRPDDRPHVLAIDVGTSALKAVVYGETGHALRAATRRYEYRVPQPGWAEADPNDWWNALIESLAELRRSFDLRAVRAVGLTGQMHTAVLLDEVGQILPPTIVWLDRRAAAETSELRDRLGLPPYHLNSTYTLPKLFWLTRNRPDVVSRVRTLLWPKDYLRRRLTGRALTDPTEAGGAALLDWERRAWAVDRLTMIGLDGAILPPMCSPEDDAGPLRPAVAAELGLAPAARVIVGAGDVIALVVGAPPAPGRLAVSLGSSAMLSCLLPDDRTIHDPRQRMYLYPLLPYRLLNGVLSTSGSSLTWACRALYGEGVPLETALQEANATPPGAAGLFFLPFLAGERSPYWSDTLRGGFYGLTLAHSRAHMLRAVLEGVAYSVRHLMEIGEELGVLVDEIALAGGGADTPGWPQIIADVCRRPLLICAGQETVTRALYAYCAEALGEASFHEALLRTFDEPRHIAPRAENASLYESIYRRYRALANFAAESMD